MIFKDTIVHAKIFQCCFFLYFHASNFFRNYFLRFL